MGIEGEGEGEWDVRRGSRWSTLEERVCVWGGGGGGGGGGAANGNKSLRNRGQQEIEIEAEMKQMSCV